jgi:mitogen-activated protein kinase 15
MLLNSDCLVKVCDFGLARSFAALSANSVSNPVLTDYVATRWYRAPEILLGSTKYTKGVDIWSVGCILGEMLGGKPTFPGTSTMNQLDRIVEVTGRPSAEDIESIKSPFAANMLESLPPSKPRFLSDMFPTASADALDLLRGCLKFNPSKRITAEQVLFYRIGFVCLPNVIGCVQALCHPYVAQFHNDSEELIYPTPPIKIALDDNTKFSVGEYRDRLYKEIVRKKKEIRRRLR